jgi:glutaredoxin
MDRSSVALTALAGIVALGLGFGASAQEKQLYRYTDADGHVVYTDKAPPPSAKNVQPKKITANVIETNEIPLAAQLASQKYPVTLYTYDCGELCRNAEALLNRRGVPFATVNVAEPDGMAKLQALTGANSVPVLQVGEKLVAKGLLEARWQSMLDEAGYPKTPTPRRTPPARASEPTARAETASPTAAAPASPATPASPAAPAADGGYPK